MKKLLALAAVASVTAFAAPAFADSSVSLGWSEWSVGDIDANTLTAHASWNQGHFGVEAEGAWGVAETIVRYPVPPVVYLNRFNIRDELGLFATAQWDVSDQFTVGARAGLANVVMKERNPYQSTAFPGSNTHVTESDGGAAYGVNATWNFTDTMGVRLDYTQYNVGLGKGVTVSGIPISTVDEDPTVLTLSLVHKFGGAAPAAAAAPK
jgi:hypothetical protein